MNFVAARSGVTGAGHLMIGWAELPRSPGHAFYDHLQALLIHTGFDGFAETQCAPYYASRRGRPSLPPGRRAAPRTEES